MFENGTDPDVAVLQTQNRVKLAEARLPSEVVVQGLSVSKVNQGFIIALGVRAPNGGVSSAELNNIISSQVLDPDPAHPGRELGQPVRLLVLDAHLAEPGQAAQRSA